MKFYELSFYFYATNASKDSFYYHALVGYYSSQEEAELIIEAILGEWPQSKRQVAHILGREDCQLLDRSQFAVKERELGNLSSEFLTLGVAI